MFYSVQRDEVYCKIRCPLERLEREAVSLYSRRSMGVHLRFQVPAPKGSSHGVLRCGSVLFTRSIVALRFLQRKSFRGTVPYVTIPVIFLQRSLYQYDVEERS